MEFTWDLVLCFFAHGLGRECKLDGMGWDGIGVAVTTCICLRNGEGGC